MNIKNKLKLNQRAIIEELNEVLDDNICEAYEDSDNNNIWDIIVDTANAIVEDRESLIEVLSCVFCEDSDVMQQDPLNILDL